jgi:hypothetical protein
VLAAVWETFHASWDSTYQNMENIMWCRLVSISHAACATPQTRRPCPATGILSLVKCQLLNAPINLFTYETTFTHNGINISHNTYWWSQESPNATVETNFQGRSSVSVWCGIIDDQVTASFILSVLSFKTKYLAFLQNELPELQEDIPLATGVGIYFQHDGAPPLFSCTVIQYLNNTFSDWWIGCGGTYKWPARSPDLNPMDYGLWGWMESQVYEIEVNTWDELPAYILAASVDIKEHHYWLRQTIRCLHKWAEMCIEVKGGILKNLL